MGAEERALGLLDSGLGGLSVFKELKKQLPHEQTIYFGDTAHIPYGDKTDNEILSYVTAIVNFLQEQKVKLIIIACNTATAVALGKIKNKHHVPIIGVIKPGAQEAVNKTKNKKIGIIGTEVTIRKESYERIIKDIDPSINTFSNACSNQIIREMEECALGDENKIKILLKECTKPLIEKGIDTLILGCTHYPLLKECIEEEIGLGIVLVDPAEAMVIIISEWLIQNGLNNKNDSKKEDLFFISGNPELFAGIARKLLGYNAGKFKKTQIFCN